MGFSLSSCGFLVKYGNYHVTSLIARFLVIAISLARCRALAQSGGIKVRALTTIYNADFLSVLFKILQNCKCQWNCSECEHRSSLYVCASTFFLTAKYRNEFEVGNSSLLGIDSDRLCSSCCGGIPSSRRWPGPLPGAEHRAGMG